MKKPEIGDQIYLPSAAYVFRGEDDFQGGLCEIDRIECSDHLPESHSNYYMVGVKEKPSSMHNYKSLMAEQDEWKKEYGDTRGHADPDLRPKFNKDDGWQSKDTDGWVGSSDSSWGEDFDFLLPEPPRVNDDSDMPGFKIQ